MAQTEKAPARAASTDHKTSIWRRFFGKDDGNVPPAPPPQEEHQRPGLGRRLSRKVVPGLPRPGTFKRQQSELRDRLEPAKPNPDERRTLSVDRRRNASCRDSSTVVSSHRLSAPQLLDGNQTIDSVLNESNNISTATANGDESLEYVDVAKEPSSVDTTYTQSVSTEAFDEMILEELEKRWILNLSMHFRDKSKREKFFVTYAETPTHWRRVTISLDYRNAPKGSLEEELQRTRFQRDKSARIYEAIRESLPDIQFYDTVTNLKLQTENDRLHVHVVEDLSEIIHYPPAKAIHHLKKCRRVREEELVFESHLSGFVYKVRVGGQVFIKKEIPGPDTVEEFLYEINALHQLSGSHSVIQFGGVVLDNKGEHVKGLLISFAEQGALIDVIYDGEGRIAWSRRERWAKQIVQGLSEIHEAGFVQGDFTLSNIVIDEHDNAKIIDINRRGCPVGWEPPEVAALLESSQRISMYIGVKSDLYQLGMVLYALATQEDEPENHRPLDLAFFPPEIPEYFRDICHHCLDDDPRQRAQASVLLTRFPDIEEFFYIDNTPEPIVIEARSPGELPNGMHLNLSRTYGQSDGYGDYATSETSDDNGYFPRRGRSPRRSRSPSVPQFARGYFNPADFPLPPSSAGSDLLGSSYATPVPNEAAFASEADATLVNEATLANGIAVAFEAKLGNDDTLSNDAAFANDIAILNEKIAPDDLPTPASICELEEDAPMLAPIPTIEEHVSTPLVVSEIDEAASIPLPISEIGEDVSIPLPISEIEEDVSVSLLSPKTDEIVLVVTTAPEPLEDVFIFAPIPETEKAIEVVTSVPGSEEDKPMYTPIVVPEDNMPTSVTAMLPNSDIPTCSPVEDVQVLTTVLGPEEGIPTPNTVIQQSEEMSTPVSMLGPGAVVQMPESIMKGNIDTHTSVRPEETIPTPTSIFGPKEDFCHIIQETEGSPKAGETTPIVTQPRKTEAVPPTPPQTVFADDLVGIGGAHSSVPLEIPTADPDDFDDRYT